VVEPGIEAEVHGGEFSNAALEIIGSHHRFKRPAMAIFDIATGIPGRDMTNPPKASAARGIMGSQDFLDSITEHHVGMSHDPGQLGPTSGVDGISFACSKYGLSHRCHMAVHRAVIIGLALDENRSDDVVARSQICEKLGREVCAPAPIPQMMVRVNDPLVEIDSGFNPFG